MTESHGCFNSDGDPTLNNCPWYYWRSIVAQESSGKFSRNFIWLLSLFKANFCFVCCFLQCYVSTCFLTMVVEHLIEKDNTMLVHSSGLHNLRRAIASIHLGHNPFWARCWMCVMKRSFGILLRVRQPWEIPDNPFSATLSSLTRPVSPWGYVVSMKDVSLPILATP